MNIHIPPLRERQDDIAPLAHHFMQLLAAKMTIPALAIDAGTINKMHSYQWPGNARELRNVIERALILGYIPEICFGRSTSTDNTKTDAEESLETMEKRHILSVMAATSGNKTEAARRLNISRKTLDRKYTEWEIQS